MNKYYLNKEKCNYVHLIILILQLNQKLLSLYEEKYIIKNILYILNYNYIRHNTCIT